MITGEIRSQIDQVWNAFWAGDIANGVRWGSSFRRKEPPFAA